MTKHLVIPTFCLGIVSLAFAGDKPKREADERIRGHVKSVNADKGKLVVIVYVGPGKETAEKYLDLAKDVRVFLEDVVTKVPQLPEGKLGDLTEHTQVEAQLDATGKSVVSINARGPGVHGLIKSVDRGRNTFVLQTKSAEGPVEETITMVEGAKVLLNDGLNKGDADQEGSLDKLSEGTHVYAQLTVDRKRALAVRPQGQILFGKVTAIDTGNNTITVNVKENGTLVDKGLTLAKGVQIEGNVTAGSPVTVRLSVFDENIVVHVRLREE